MATTTDPTELAADANCLNCIPPGMQWPVAIWILAQIAGVTTDPTTLAANAACLNCIPPGMQMPIIIWLLTQISSGGGGGSGAKSNVQAGTDPNGVITGNQGDFAWMLTNTTFWIKQTAGGNTGWVQLI
jgi:hypothetical protein